MNRMASDFVSRKIFLIFVYGVQLIGGSIITTTPYYTIRGCDFIGQLCQFKTILGFFQYPYFKN